LPSTSEQLNAVEEVRRLFEQIFASEDGKRKSADEPIFVSFDVAHGNKKGFSAIGVSLLDTRSFAGKLKNHEHTHSPLWTRTYIFNYGSQGVRLAQKRALFDGDAQKVTPTDRILLLRHLFSYYNEEVEPCCQSQKFLPFQPSARDPDLSSRATTYSDARPIVVVGHSVPQDIYSLSKVGFDITQVAPVVAFMDTQKIARELYWREDRSKNISLKDLCTLIGIQPIKLHNSGNDAAYTLVVLLSLASRILGNDIHETLKELIQSALVSAKTTTQKRKETEQDEHTFEDWAENLNSENF
jgi:hypothetical protein